MYVEDLVKLHTCSVIAASVSVNPYVPWLVGYVGCVPLVSLTSLTPTILPSHSSVGFLKLQMMILYMYIMYLEHINPQLLYYYTRTTNFYYLDVFFFNNSRSS